MHQLAPLFLLITSTVAAAQGTHLISAADDGSAGNAASRRPHLVQEGRWIAFESDASDLVPGDTNDRTDVFVVDRLMRTIELVSRPPGGQGNANSLRPNLSADGRWVAFVSGASNLVPNDTNGKRDIFVADRLDGSIRRISVTSGGAQTNGTDDRPSFAADGRFVLFESGASNMVPNDTNGSFDVFVHDRDPDDNGIYDEGNGTTVRVSVNSGGSQANAGAFFPQASKDGRFLSFHSSSTNLVPGDSNGRWDVFVHDRDPDGNGLFDEGNGVTTRESVRPDGAQLTQDSRDGDLSGDGRWISFWSESAALAPGDTNGVGDVFVRDRWDGTVVRVSVSSTGVEGDLESTGSGVSSDGRFVAFGSLATTLDPTDTNGSADVYLHDRDPDGNGLFDEGNATTERVSVGPLATQGDLASSISTLSESGRFIAFDSAATTFDLQDTNGASDVFLRDTSRLSLSGRARAGQPVTLSLDRAFGAEGRVVQILASCTGTNPPTILSTGPLPLTFDAWTRWSLGLGPAGLQGPVADDGSTDLPSFRFPSLSSGSVLTFLAVTRTQNGAQVVPIGDALPVTVP